MIRMSWQSIYQFEACVGVPRTHRRGGGYPPWSPPPKRSPARHPPDPQPTPTHPLRGPVRGSCYCPAGEGRLEKRARTTQRSCRPSSLCPRVGLHLVYGPWQCDGPQAVAQLQTPPPVPPGGSDAKEKFVYSNTRPQFRASFVVFVVFRRKSFLMWVGGRVGRLRLGTAPNDPPSPPGGGGEYVSNNQHIPQYANYWAPLTHKRHIPPHPAQPTERSDPTQHAKGRTGACSGPRKETTTRRHVRRGGGWVGRRSPGCHSAPPPPPRPQTTSLPPGGELGNGET